MFIPTNIQLYQTWRLPTYAEEVIETSVVVGIPLKVQLNHWGPELVLTLNKAAKFTT